MNSKHQNYKNAISNILETIDIEEFSSDLLDKLIPKFISGLNPLITSFDLNTGNEEVLILIVKNWENNNDKLLKRLEKVLNDNQKSLNSISNLYIFEIFEGIRHLNIDKNKAKQIRKVIQTKINEHRFKNEKMKLSAIKFDYSIVSNIENSNTVKIDIESRVRSIEHSVKLEDDLELISYVYKAKLGNVLELYNIMGNSLFQNNLRIGLQDQLNVDTSISKTITNNPSSFWFLNNGISLYLPDYKQLSENYSDSIAINFSRENLPSVLNGAQTISALAKSSLEVNDENKSYVLLRIYTFKSNKCKNNKVSKEKQKYKIDEITIALNRQKPIRQEDVAYTYETIQNINAIADEIDNNFSFQIVRRGEKESVVNKNYILINFARMITAYYKQNPGDARSKGAASLLKGNASQENFENTSIPDINETTDFNQKLKPMNFAFKLKKYLSYEKLLDIIKNLEDEKSKNENLLSLINYGRYFLIALIIYTLNNNNNNDFTNWQYTNIGEDNNKSTFTYKELENTLINIFNKFYEKYGESDDLESNNFKKNEIYNDFIKFYSSSQNKEAK